MTKIGLIRPFNNNYRYGGKIAYAKQYMYFYENEVKFIEYCKKENITILDSKPKAAAIITDSSIDVDRVKIGKSLYLKKPTNLTCDEFENYLLECFKKNYPEYQKYKEMVNEINKYYEDKPDFQIKFEPSFH